MRHVHRGAIWPRGKEFGDPGMQLLPAGHDHVLVDGLARERVPELIFAGSPLVFLEQLVGDASLQRRVHSRFVHTGDTDQRLDVGGPTDDRGGRKHVHLFLAQPLETVEDRRLHRARDSHLGQRLPIPA